MPCTGDQRMMMPPGCVAPPVHVASAEPGGPARRAKSRPATGGNVGVAVGLATEVLVGLVVDVPVAVGVGVPVAVAVTVTVGVLVAVGLGVICCCATRSGNVAARSTTKALWAPLTVSPTRF